MKPYTILTALCALLCLAGARADAQPAHAKTINAYQLWSAPYSLNGEGQFIGIFEQDKFPTKNHPEFKSPTAGITYADPASGPLGLHATQVTGLILAKGAKATARGIARKAKADLFIADGSIQAYLDQAALWEWDISCHAYGINRGWRQVGPTAWQWVGTLEGTAELNTAGTEDRAFGYYDDWARRLDSLLYRKPTQIPVIAAGNQRGLAPPAGVAYQAATPDGFVSSTTAHPKNGGANGYDVLVSQGLAKNALVVGAVDATGALWAHSNTGPTDDGRIKPDVVALGVDVTVCGSSNSVNGYDTLADGTSYAAPAVAGSLALLQQYWAKKFLTTTMLSSTARGLMIHTATDLGTPGPDYRHGWGRVNVKAAADLIDLNATNNRFSMQERTLLQGETMELYIKAAPDAFSRITIAWTDPEGTPVEKLGGYIQLNEPTPMLVNDLDIRVYPILNGKPMIVPYLPYAPDRTKPSQAAERGDNSVDNVEQAYFQSIDLSTFGTFDHTYKVVVRHKGTLRGGKQAFSLFVSGATLHLPAPTGLTVGTGGIAQKNATVTLAANSAFAKWNATPGAQSYDVQYRKVGALSWTSINSVTKPEAKLENLEQANYQTRVRARNGVVVGAFTNILQFFGGTPVSPANIWSSAITPTSAKISWSAVGGVTQYEMTWAPISQNGTTIGAWSYRTVTGTSTQLTSLTPDQSYACYVRSKYSAALSSDWNAGVGFYTTVDCASHEPNTTFDKGRNILTNEYYEGLLCKDDKEDWYRIQAPATGTNLQITLYEHSKPFRLALYRQAKSGGTVSPVPGAPPAGIGTKVMTANGVDFNAYNYFVQVWSPDPATIYHNTETYTMIARTSTKPYTANVHRDEARKETAPRSGATSEISGGMTLYPNPASDAAIVRFASPDAGATATITIHDLTGQTVLTRYILTEPDRTQCELSTGDLPTGAYLVRVRVNDHRMTQRLNVQR